MPKPPSTCSSPPRWLRRSDFVDAYIDPVTAPGSSTPIAFVAWPGAITALGTATLASSGGEARMLPIAASLAAGIPVDLRDALTGLETDNIGLVSQAIHHACGRPPQPFGANPAAGARHRQATSMTTRMHDAHVRAASDSCPTSRTAARVTGREASRSDTEGALDAGGRPRTIRQRRLLWWAELESGLGAQQLTSKWRSHHIPMEAIRRI